jgi:hypothetical protein
MPSQREQYGGTVLLFIGTGNNPYKITFMPFTFDNNSIVICRGLNSLFILSRFRLLLPRRSFPAHTFGPVSTFVLLWSTAMLTRIRRYLFTHYTPEILLNPVFEDLRMPKVPNTLLRTMLPWLRITRVIFYTLPVIQSIKLGEFTLGSLTLALIMLLCIRVRHLVLGNQHMLNCLRRKLLLHQMIITFHLRPLMHHMF